MAWVNIQIRLDFRPTITLVRFGLEMLSACLQAQICMAITQFILNIAGLAPMACFCSIQMVWTSKSTKLNRLGQLWSIT